MALDNRLTTDQLDGLAPGDTVVIESATDRGRPRCTTGTVVRVEHPHIVVSHQTRHGGRYIERYRCRDGVRVGGLGRAELIQDNGPRPARDDTRRRTAEVDAAYREWTRNRADVDRLRRLREAIEECLRDGAGVG